MMASHSFIDIHNFKKILILGSPGAGKTTFSKRLAKVLKLPLYHLDDLYWKEKWVRIDKEEWDLILHELCNKSKWIIDGNHFKTIEKRLKNTDLVILLDFPVRTTAWRFLYRSIKRYIGLEKDSLPEKIKNDLNYTPFFTIEWHLIKLVLFFKINTKPKILKLIHKYQTSLIMISSKKELENLINHCHEINE